MLLLSAARLFLERFLFFQDLRNRKSDSPYSSIPGVRYVAVNIKEGVVHVGPFKTEEAHSLDEELSDSRQKLPVWKHWYADLIEICIRQAESAGRSEHIRGEAFSRAKLLLEFSQSIAHVQDVNKALYTAVQFLVHKFKLSNILIAAYGKRARYFDLSDSGVVVEQRVIAHVKSAKTLCTIQNITSDFLLDGIKEREKLSKCVVGFPLTLKNEFIGYAVIFSEQLPPLDNISEVLYELTAVLSRLAHYEKVQESAVTDVLTGIYNRAELTKRLDKFLTELSKRNLPISVFMIDVDNFKKFNDTRGHPEGDRVLKAIAELLRSSIPENAVCCRYGGEEFVVILPAATQTEAKDVAEKLRSEIEKNCDLTISIGLIICMNSSASREKLIKEADRALYRAKHLGKNRVVTYVMVDKSLGIVDG